MLTSLSLPLGMLLGLHDEFRERMLLAIQNAQQLPQPLLVPELRLQVARNHLTYNIGQQVDVSLPRARHLAELTGKDRHRMEPLVTISSTHISTAQYETAAVIGERALELAQRSGDEYAVLSASRAMAQAAHYAGQHQRATELATAVLRHPVRNIPYTYGFMHTDRRITMRWVLTRSLWMSGRADEARRVAEEGIVIAPDAGPVALAQLLGMAVIPVYLWCGDFERARELTAMLFEHAARYSFKHWAMWGELFDAAIGWHMTGSPVSPATGDLQVQTLSTIVGLAAPLPTTINLADWSAPELLRLRGERDSSEADLTDALQLARQHGARAWELRCAMSLGRLWASTRRRMEAMDLLSGTLEQLPEGHGTADPIAARALLAELA